MLKTLAASKMMASTNLSESITSKSGNATGFDSHLYYNNVYHSCLIVLALAIAFHNGLVIYLYKKTFSLQTHTNYLLANLACSDMLTGLFVIPLVILAAVFSGRDGKIIILYFFANVAGDFVTVLIVLALTAVTLERYICLSFPLRYEILIEKGRIRCMVTLIWVFAFIVSFLPIVWTYNTLIGNGGREDVENDNLIHSLFLLVVCFFLPAGVMLFAQVSMFLVVRRLNSNEALKHQRYSNGGKEERKVFIIFMVMYVGLLLCWTPLISLRLIVDTGSPLPYMDPVIPEFLFACRCWTSLFNPVLYVWCKTDFKAAFTKKFRRSKDFHNRKCRKNTRSATETMFCQSATEMSTKV